MVAHRLIGQCMCNRRFNIPHGLLNRFTPEQFLIPIAQFKCLVDTSRHTGRNGCASKRTVVEDTLNFDRWVSPGIKNLTGMKF